MKISFHGAAEGVTGSCHLIQVAGKKLLIDCGLFQGSREVEEDNAKPFGFDPAAIDYLLLTHAHLDHCGRIPLLAKQGFEGEIITTMATQELARVVMLDSAHLNEEDVRRKNRKLKRKRHVKALIEPLYTTEDALYALNYFGRRASYNKPIQVAKGIKATFIDAGHILGSACIFLELEEEGRKRTVLFSGDLGTNGRAILRDPDTPPHADVVVMETTYGDRAHKELEPSIDEFFEAINKTVSRGGNIIVPTFALERAQELLYYLHEGWKEKQLPRGLQVFLDSPMAITATNIFARHPECYDNETKKLFASGHDPFDFPSLHFSHEASDSMALNNIHSGALILAGSGMCTGGRVRHHLKKNIWRKECSVIFVGFAARGTLARRIVDGAKTVSIFGEEIAVNAQIYTIGGFSAHAGQGELLAWHKSINKPQITYLVHGEVDAMEVFAGLLEDTEVRIGKRGQEYEL
ncbi:MBL fold metallo-hydrolase [Cocleimonas sp. KMM 6892]|uniref:MBL fold metallo-hydrolase n=1 Tax=unclassified Cocleimonas TaxID=2639732 RepID=UPI002DBB6D2E|nr:MULTISPECIES: MBL fold metallo-hydrolase [unclassified Cocleimonas]MEB8431035.1 MBL fold metallo-hydrolase [Cocleimonas sp. KMM 6892]MEC4714193.1 MBL fold metallo-hydrolase [Cocleimonas sp. KMM 6895]MEC4743524.1 MBL fold metallo-hydrolase [Cocleimonas sp. KMM 6896]